MTPKTHTTVPHTKRAASWSLSRRPQRPFQTRPTPRTTPNGSTAECGWKKETKAKEKKEQMSQSPLTRGIAGKKTPTTGGSGSTKDNKTRGKTAWRHYITGITCEKRRKKLKKNTVQRQPLYHVLRTIHTRDAQEPSK